MNTITAVVDRVFTAEKRPRLRDGDFEKPGHRHTWRLLVNVAGSMGVDVSEADAYQWRSMLRVTRNLDDLVDDNGILDIGGQLEELKKGESIGEIDSESAEHFKNFIDNHSHGDTLLHTISLLPEFARRKKAASSVEELDRAMRQEAVFFTPLLALELNEDQPDIQARQRFNEWLEGFVLSGYVFDWVLDMKKDFEDGSIQVEPSLVNRTKLAKSAISDLLRSVRKTPKRDFAKIGYVAFRNEVPKTSQ